MDWNNPYIHSVVLIVAITIAFLTIMLLCAVTVLAERRVLAFIQGRLGPNRVGYRRRAATLRRLHQDHDEGRPGSGSVHQICFPAGADDCRRHRHHGHRRLSFWTHDHDSLTYGTFPLVIAQIRCGLALRAGRDFGRCLRNRTRRLVFKQQIQPDGRTAIGCADDFL